MNVVVLAGSPKGHASVTLQSVRWLERRYPEHTFAYHRVAQRIKRLDHDRQFFESHRPILNGVKMGILIAGPLSLLPHLREVLEAYAELHHAELVGIVCDEERDSSALDRRIDDLDVRLVRAAESGYASPTSFRGIGSAKICRDAVYGWMRFPFAADHQSFKERGMYDFPQRDRRGRLSNALLTSAVRIPKVRDRVYSQLKRQMVARHRAVVDGAEPATADRSEA